MSRNLGQTDCYFCQGVVALVEPERAVGPADTGSNYFPEYVGMLVASAECVDCKAKYLAWTWAPAGWASSRGRTHDRSDGPAAFDLSFRSSFNDEPGAADLPEYEVVARTPVLVPWPHRCEQCKAKIMRADSPCFSCWYRPPPTTTETSQ